MRCSEVVIQVAEGVPDAEPGAVCELEVASQRGEARKEEAPEQSQ